MDSKQSEIVEKYQEQRLKSDDVDDDELLELLDEDDSALQQYREARIQQLSKEFNKIKDATSSMEFGNVVDVDNERELMDAIAKSEYALVHFYQPNFEKCKIMTNRLLLLAEKHLTLKIYSIKAENSPFLVNKLLIKVLPFVVIYKAGKEIDRLVGFEKLGNDPSDFSYNSLELYLMRMGILNRKTINFASRKNEDDLESDLDI